MGSGRDARKLRGRTSLEVPLAEEIADSILEVIGNTPLVRLHKVVRGVRAEVVAKLEYLNPGGSVKDRIGVAMIEDAERRGLLRPGGTIVEATSGNTGVGLAMAAAVKGYKTVFVLPDKMSQEKIQLLRAFGARVVITPTAVPPEDPRSYYSVSRRIAQETPNAFYAGQYHNPMNPRAHYETTGPEIWKQTRGKVDILVAGMGTGGTISGAGRFLKERNSSLTVVGVDPIGSVYTEYFKSGRLGEAHTYKVEGIGEDFLPETMDFSVVDQVVQVTDREAFLMTRRLVREEGIFAGGSSGAALAGALKYLRTLPDHGAGKRVVVIFPDGGARYLSKIFSDDWMREHGFLESGLGVVADILRGKRLELITASPGDSIGVVIAKMKQYDISQLPVLEDSGLVGMITEVDLLNHLLEGGYDPEDPIAPIVDPAPPVVNPDTPIEQVAELFISTNAAVVVEQGRVVGIVTKIDLIDHLSRQRKDAE
ncbi:MAG: cystathionine beta-synthase [Armatimonadota bacterium]|nr:cystathionine beta-synthase [Armatimonadota bacterium]MDR5703336.1 cystathionine beta-synthase [Armatimonadota bacterium]MDR7433518.1 cystathionine beta-synthase [Armatimonadota bacterium]